MKYIGIHSMKWGIEKKHQDWWNATIFFILSAVILSVCSLCRQETNIEKLTPWFAKAHFSTRLFQKRIESTPKHRKKSGTYPIGYSRICPRKWNKKAVENNPQSYMDFPFWSLCEVNFFLDFGLKRSYKTWDEQDLDIFIGVYYVCHKSMRRNLCLEVASIYINPLEHTSVQVRSAGTSKAMAEESQGMHFWLLF